MPRRMITDERVLMERAKSYLPKDINKNAIVDVECDPTDPVSHDDGGSYWVYLDYGYICPSMGCHTIHEDTLKDLKEMIREVEYIGEQDSHFEYRKVIGWCPRCGGPLNYSRNPEYFAECMGCDEDFFDCEVDGSLMKVIKHQMEMKGVN